MPSKARNIAGRPIGRVETRDWIYLAIIIAFGGSSFAMIRGAVETIPPAVIAVSRLWIGAAVLCAFVVAKRRKFPKFLAPGENGPRLHRAWGSMLAVGVVGNTVPFFIFPWAQQYVDSGLAGIYMAFMPIWTLGLGFLFADESITPQKVVGFGLGFVGVVILMGPDAMSGAASASTLAQAAMLFAAFLYAGSAVLARRAPPVRPRVYAAGVLLCAAVAATPSLFFVDFASDQWSLTSILCVIGLGVFPTGLNAFVIVALIRRAGAGFMALANYLTPLWAVLLGAAIYAERLSLSTFLALGVILIGVFVTQRRPAPQSDLDNASLHPDSAAAHRNLADNAVDDGK